MSGLPRLESLRLIPLKALSALSILSFLGIGGVVGDRGGPDFGMGRLLLALSDNSIPLSVLPADETAGNGSASS